MKNNSINLGFTAEQWQSHMRTAFELSGKATADLETLARILFQREKNFGFYLWRDDG